ncbi:hypothetical protein DRF60_04985 [Chryseobacterium elymi]|uniref:Uncharacterized protein n=1 Tax=Chryseobacterium elymi TaxID=395936 RepID=A0A3D9DP65_9FLAO|nr:hypothetical protein [Chryseobacterium elymi]REC79759.1 hypothetical protein DRF60_04985 [Chryseobacterium elymi]
MTIVEQLYEILDQRRRPEDVAEIIIELLKKGSLKRSMFGYTPCSKLSELLPVLKTDYKGH